MNELEEKNDIYFLEKLEKAGESKIFPCDPLVLVTTE